MIIDKYLLSQVVQPFGAILGVLLAIFASYSAAIFLADAVNGVLPTGVIVELVALKSVISLEVLIPASLYVSVIVGFARLHADSEFTAMAAIGVRRMTTMRAVLTMSASLALVVGGLSLFVRPLAYARLHELTTQAASLVDVDAMQPGTFYVTGKGSRVVLFDDRNGPAGAASNVFVRVHDQDVTRVIFAKHANSLQGDMPPGEANVFLDHANVYDLPQSSGHPDGILHADGMTVNANGRSVAPPGYSAVAASSPRIARSAAPEDVAEFQWRLFTPLSTLLLGLLAIPMSRPRMRESRQSHFSTAILIYFGYYLLSTAARTWVQHGTIARFPGIWWVSVLLTLLVLTLMSASGLGQMFQRVRE